VDPSATSLLVRDESCEERSDSDGVPALVGHGHARYDPVVERLHSGSITSGLQELADVLEELDGVGAECAAGFERERDEEASGIGDDVGVGVVVDLVRLLVAGRIAGC